MNIRKKIIYGVLLLLITLLVLWRGLFVFSISNISFGSDIKYNWAQNGNNTYDKDCLFETERKIMFPLEKANYCIIYRGVLLKDIRIDSYRTQEIITVLNDTSSYRWGEVGTYFEDWKIIFYNSNNNIIGITSIDLGGYTYSSPYIRKMKWGSLRDESLGRLMRIIYPISD